MHVLIALLTAVATLLYALERIGVDIGWINPWAWKRKRAWQKAYHANPAFSLENPMEAIALALCATAKIDGDLTLEEKDELNNIFSSEFRLSSEQSNKLLRSSIFLIGSDEEIFKRPKDILSPSLNQFTDEQKESSILLLNRISNIGGQASASQQKYIQEIENTLKPSKSSNTWS